MDLPTESTQSGLPENKRMSPEDQQKTRKSPAGTTMQVPETTPSQERGERIDTGKTIARGGKTTGDVPGATEQK
jgi:hypothetical protein